jgi:geranylgeranyl pyrophosphate synthase
MTQIGANSVGENQDVSQKNSSPGADTSCAPPCAASERPQDLSTILAPVQKELTESESFLRSNLVDNSTFVTELLSQIFQAGGKRIRPALCLLSARATSGNDVDQLQIILSVLTELIHTASLVHDDVIDQANLRRGKETVNRKWNDKLAVLVGDLLFAQASICLAKLQSPTIVGIYGQVLGDLCAGELAQMQQKYLCTVNWDNYIRKSVCKTASLFAAGCKSAAILNNQSDRVVTAMSDYGLNLGICFQIIDDLLDVTSSESKLGKPAGSDLANGVITAPALFVLERKDQAAKNLEKLITSRAISSESNEEALAEALEIIRDTGAIESTMALAHGYAKVCHQLLADYLPESPYRQSLHSLADFMLQRST